MSEYEIVTLAAADLWSIWYIYVLPIYLGLLLLGGALVWPIGFRYYNRHEEKLKRRGSPGWPTIWGMILFIFMTVIGTAVTFGSANAVKSGWDHDQRVQALEELGYENITVKGNSFTASEDGAYTEGEFFSLDENREYAVVILVGGEQ